MHPISPVLTIEILGVLGVLLAASALTFTVLVRRWTTQRERVAMIDWGRQRGFQLGVFEVQRLGPPLDVLKKYAARPAICLDDGRTRIVQVSSDPPPRPDGRPGAGEMTWRLLVRRIEPSLRAAGIRPAHEPHSFIDLFSLSSFPSAGGNEKFVLLAGDSEAAGEFPDQAIGSMSPRDVGVLVIDEALILDFSARPFDDLEFSRMTAIADQIARKITEPG